MTATADCEREIRELHDFVAGDYTTKREDFERVESALHPEFSLVRPSGFVADRSTGLEGVRESEGQYDPGEFDIEIGNVEMIERGEERALVRYEESEGERHDRSTQHGVFGRRQTGDERPPSGGISTRRGSSE
ncbi:hypothetical protein GRX03_08205 [Halovenus sp. WSH3]|uniref:DUF4440 domain-containing protein n=1 Tax=Halovenus carboxidivorans TaxID=2692199 RepID=A0A6B0T0M7_9EURY|nr:hypothetical protein [Halovenus carboxidivorans]MXR51584.1 hypothetical protein [Halovenus carboxidivorans]